MAPTQTPPKAAPNEPVFTSTIPFDVRRGSTLVIYCADGRFRQQTHEFLTQHLKLDRPVTITVPGGVSVFMPLVGFAHKILKGWLDTFSDHATRIVVIAHEDCAAYQAEHGILDKIVTKIVGSSLQDLQRRHLSGARSMLRTWYPHAEVETYFAGIVEGPGGSKQVAFTAIT